MTRAARSRQASVDSGTFSAGPGAVHLGNDLLAVDGLHVSALDLGGLTLGGRWRLDACRDAAAWVPIGGSGRRFLRYGGRACGGDVPASAEPVLALVDLTA
ncbi:hypothetical protein [Dactylosporangium sp. CS-033363]|uniref:hypothetical protein n=1 Tax=Dactylosporangium sp. CS-033363 TaxID=3239935 RepID=UPI003D8F1C3E